MSAVEKQASWRRAVLLCAGLSGTIIFNTKISEELETPSLIAAHLMGGTFFSKAFRSAGVLNEASAWCAGNSQLFAHLRN